MKQIFKKYDISLNEKQEEQFHSYYRLLCEWNEKMNLTAITEYEAVVRKHFLDSVLLTKCEEYTEQKIKKILDLGTGAGFPGIPLAILNPDKSFTLVDSLNKRIEFLKEVKNTLSLENVNLYHGRAEDLGRDFLFRNQFDITVSRAVAELPLLMEYCIPFVKPDGYFISYKGPRYEEEIWMADHAMKELNARLEEVRSFSLEEEEKRYLLFIRNETFTNEKYPRRAGKPKKNPL